MGTDKQANARDIQDFVNRGDDKGTRNISQNNSSGIGVNLTSMPKLDKEPIKLGGTDAYAKSAQSSKLSNTGFTGGNQSGGILTQPTTVQHRPNTGATNGGYQSRPMGMTNTSMNNQRPVT